MTTESKPQRLGATEWRLYAVAAIAAVYLIAWRGITAVAPPPPVAVAPPPPPPAARWIDELPRVQQPPLAPPAGWHVASRTETVRPVVRAPVQRPLRVRTRSS